MLVTEYSFMMDTSCGEPIQQKQLWISEETKSKSALSFVFQSAVLTTWPEQKKHWIQCAEPYEGRRPDKHIHWHNFHWRAQNKYGAVLHCNALESYLRFKWMGLDGLDPTLKASVPTAPCGNKNSYFPHSIPKLEHVKMSKIELIKPANNIFMDSFWSYH